MINIFLGVITVIGLMFTGWYFVHPDSSQWTIKLPPDEPNMIIEQIHVIKFSPEGQPLHNLATHKLLHYPEGNKTVLLKPNINVTPDKQMPWNITAEQGNALDGTKQLTLIGNVRMQQSAGLDQPARTVISDELTYYPDKKFATTRKYIAMEQPGLKISAVGMNAHIEKEQVELLSKVEIHYQGDTKNIQNHKMTDKANAQPIHVRADYAALTNKQGKTVYRDKVEFNQGTSHLRAAEAITTHNSKNELLNAIAKGNTKERAYFWAVVEAGKPEMHAKADIIEFLPKEQKILLIGNAEVTQGNDRFNAPQIEYDIVKRHIRSKALPQAKKTNGRTTIFIRLKDHQKK